MKPKSTMKKNTAAGVICFIVIAAIATGVILTAGSWNQGSVAWKDDGQDLTGGAVGGVQDLADADGGEQGAIGQDGATGGGQTPSGQPGAERPGVTRINVYSTDRDLDRIIKLYADEHWDFDYTINFYTDAITLGATDVVSITGEALISGDGSKLDMYCLPAAFAPEFIKGEYSDFACPYKELGIDIDAALKKADIPQCLIEDGSNPDGELIALPYMVEAALFMYRRSVAKEVFGTDDPDRIAAIIGAGTQKWDKFIEAAQTLKKHGYYISPGYRDLEYMVDTSPSSFRGMAEGFEADTGWVEFMDISKHLLDKAYIKRTKPWSEEWRSDLGGKNGKVFGFVTYTDMYQFLDNSETAGDWAACIPPFNTRVPSYTGIMVNRNSPNRDLLGPLVEWITLDSSEDGYQYSLANGTSGNVSIKGKLSVSSGTVMKKVDGSRSILGGQNINPLVSDALKGSKGLHLYNFYEHESDIYSIWRGAVDAYIEGEKDRDTAISDFYSQVRKSGKVQPTAVPSRDEPVVWKDKNFEAAVRNQLRIPVAEIYKSNLLNVTDLDLSGRKIKSLEDIVHFENLTRLYCSNSQITDISCLKGLKKLSTLEMHGNMISDISALGNLTNLRELYLNSNKISDISSLKGLSRLETLYLRENEITDINGLGGQESLKILDISKNRIKDISSLGGLKGLRELVMTDNDISDISSLRGLKELERLTLYNNQVTDIGSLSGLTKLNSIQADKNEITDISNLSRLPGLEHLYLSDNKISNIGSLAQFKNLNTLEISNNRISDISSLAGLQKLEYLDLAFNRISDISSLKKLTNLKYLVLAGNNISDRSPVDHVDNVHWNQIITPPSNYYDLQ